MQAINAESQHFAVRCSDAVLVGQWDNSIRPTLTHRIVKSTLQCQWVPQTSCVALLSLSGLVFYDALTKTQREPLLSGPVRLIAAMTSNTLAVICEPAASVYSSANADMFQALSPSPSTVLSQGLITRRRDGIALKCSLHLLV